jgi:hypothetical protein
MKVNRKEKITHTHEKFVYINKKNFHPEIKYDRLKHVRTWVEPKKKKRRDSPPIKIELN